MNTTPNRTAAVEIAKPLNPFIIGNRYLNCVIGRGLMCLLGVACAAHLMTAAAATISWTNSSGGNWSAATNWTPNQVPGPADNALITTNGTYAVTLDVGATIGS